MELRKVDPRTIRFNAANPRKIQAGELSDAALVASIKAVGILQPPVVTETHGELTLSYGARRVRSAIAAELAEIDVLVRDPDENDTMRALSENAVRAPMATVDLWRAIESLASENWTEEAIGTALAIPVRQVRKLRLLGKLHPPILEQIGAGDMPQERELRVIASASLEEQEAVWKARKPKKGERATWWQVAQALQTTRFYAKHAKFGPEEQDAFGIVWQEDLFAEGDDDNRFTTNGDAFLKAQEAWLQANLPKNGVSLEIDSYGNPKLPPKAQRIWTKPKKKDSIGFAVNPRDGSIVEAPFTIPVQEKTAGKNAAAGEGDADAAPLPKKPRPEITQEGVEMIGQFRTAALTKALEVNPCNDTTLIGLLILAFTADNVSMRTGAGFGRTGKALVRSILEGGALTADMERLRVVARQMLASFLSCDTGMNGSGLVARIAGDAIGADVHLPDMATEEFLSCLSKPGVEKAASAFNVLPRPRGKDTRAALITAANGKSYTHPAAAFALTHDELEAYMAPPRSYSWEKDEGGCDEEGSEASPADGVEAAEEGGETENAPADPEDEVEGEDLDAADPEDAPARSRRRARKTSATAAEARAV